MKRAAVIQHVSFEDLGSFAGVLSRRGFELRHFLAGRDALTSAQLGDPDLVVVLGGPISANDAHLYPFLDDELQFLGQRLRERRPCLGVCLGAQLMSKALGGQVTPMQHKEIGWSPLDLHTESVLSALRGIPVLHWHGEQFTIPEGGASLASTPLCPNQAFAVGNFALGLQFHPEVTHRGLELWYVAHCAELAQAGADIQQLRREAEVYCGGLEQRAMTVLEAWLDGWCT